MMTESENGEGNKIKKGKLQRRAISSAITVVKWATTSLSAPTINQKRL